MFRNLKATEKSLVVNQLVHLQNDVYEI